MIKIERGVGFMYNSLSSNKARKMIPRGTIINHNCVNRFQESVWAMILTYNET